MYFSAPRRIRRAKKEWRKEKIQLRDAEVHRAQWKRKAGEKKGARGRMAWSAGGRPSLQDLPLFLSSLFPHVLLRSAFGFKCHLISFYWIEMFREVCAHVEFGGGIREAKSAPNKLYPFAFLSLFFSQAHSHPSFCAC